MFSKILSEQIYLGDYGWHTGRFHFSFADYDDPSNTHFGYLIAFNDFVVQPGSGFETHPHNEIEIISYCVEGELVHEDGMGNRNTLKQGDMQYTCAGSGITHSEVNNSLDKPLRFVQIWIQPNAKNLTPYYGFTHFLQKDRLNKLLQIASGQQMGDVTRINQDTNIYVSEVEAGRILSIGQLSNRQVYLVCLDGVLRINEVSLKKGDLIKVWDEIALTLTAVEDSHLVIVEMPRSI